MSTIVASLDLSSNWDPVPDMMEEELSATSSEEASKVYEAWQTDDQQGPSAAAQDADDLMEVDEYHLDSTLFNEDFFFDSSVSSPHGVEELVFDSFGADIVDRFSVPLLDNSDVDSGLTFEARYKETLKKLTESMRRSKETRSSLKIQTPKMEEYERRKSVTGVLHSIEKSSKELQGYLSQIQKRM